MAGASPYPTVRTDTVVVCPQSVNATKGLGDRGYCSGRPTVNTTAQLSSNFTRRRALLRVGRQYTRAPIAQT